MGCLGYPSIYNLPAKQIKYIGKISQRLSNCEDPYFVNFAIYNTNTNLFKKIIEENNKLAPL